MYIHTFSRARIDRRKIETPCPHDPHSLWLEIVGAVGVGQKHNMTTIIGKNLPTRIKRLLTKIKWLLTKIWSLLFPNRSLLFFNRRLLFFNGRLTLCVLVLVHEVRQVQHVFCKYYQVAIV